MLLHIKNMVCDRCILIVRQQLESLQFDVSAISLGKVEISPEPDERQLQNIASAFEVLGFELIDSQKDKLMEQIKTKVIELVHYSDLNALNKSIISVIAEDLNKDYAYLSRLFSDAAGTTIEKYIIQQKIEKVKELLEYGELNLNEIAYKMGYSSSAHLSTQFKTITGLSPRQYKATTGNQRTALDQVK
jgi:AraC family transcriptional regulator